MAGTKALAAEPQSPERWTRRARPTFLYVMYAMILWAIPLGMIAGFAPHAARDMGAAMTGYLTGIPDELYALFGTGYLGYTAARTWGKLKQAEK